MFELEVGVQLLNGWMVEVLNCWRVKLVNCWMVELLDGYIVELLNGRIVEWFVEWLLFFILNPKHIHSYIDSSPLVFRLLRWWHL